MKDRSKVSVNNNINMLNNIMKQTEEKKKMMCGGLVKSNKKK